MGWRVKQYKDGKFAIYSSVTDSFISGKMTRANTLKFISDIWKKELKVRIQNLENTFPNGWMDHDTYKIIQPEMVECGIPDCKSRDCKNCNLRQRSKGKYE